MSDLRTTTDQMGREVTYAFPPKRILSLVPSQTEFLLDIGAPVIGRTKFCIHPANQVQKVSVVGGTKNFRMDQIQALRPDLIIGNKEENFEEGISALQKDFPVWMSDIYTLEDAYGMMEQLGALCQLEQAASVVIQNCRKAMTQIKGRFSGRVVYLIWRNPYMAAGATTFIDSVLEFLGYENLVQEVRYPEFTEEKIRDLEPDFILHSSEPYPFKQHHLDLAEKTWPNAISKLVDGELFSWYGSRLAKWSEINH